MSFIALVLPFPPSVNHYWRHVVMGKSARAIISKRGREYRETAKAAVVEQMRGCPQFTGRLAVEVLLFPPDRRKRDVDNFAKSLLDAITHAGCWEDDNQIDRLVIERREPGEGKAVVRITESAA